MSGNPEGNDNQSPSDSSITEDCFNESPPPLQNLGRAQNQTQLASSSESDLLGHDSQKLPTSVQNLDGLNNRPLSASSASSVDSGSTTSATSTTSLLRTSRRKTWRMSIQEQNDEQELITVDNAVAKCKSLQGEVRELEATLLEVNTANTRLQNDNLRYQQTSSQRDEDFEKLQTEHKTTVALLEMTKKENEELKQSRKEADIEFIKMQNNMLNAQTETGKAMRELARRTSGENSGENSGDYTEFVATEERLLATIAALKKELNLLRQEKSDLTDTVQELEKKLEVVPQVVDNSEEQAMSEMRITALQEQVNAFDGNMSAWFGQVEKIQSLLPSELDSRGSSPAPVDEGDSKVGRLSSVLGALHEKIQEETEYSNHLASFTKELVAKLGQALEEEVSIDRTYSVEEAAQIAVEIVERACVKIKSGGNSGNTKDLDALHRSVDMWIMNVSAALRECSSRCFLTTSNEFPPTSFTEKVTYLSDMCGSLEYRVKNAFDRFEEEQEKRSARYKKRLEQSQENVKKMAESLKSLALDVQVSTNGNDPLSLIDEVAKAVKDLKKTHQGQTSLAGSVNEKSLSDEEFETTHHQLLGELMETDEIVERKESLMRKVAQQQIDFIANFEADVESMGAPTLLNELKEVTKSINVKKQNCLSLIQKMKDMWNVKSSNTSEKGDGEMQNLAEKLKEMEAEFQRKNFIIEEFKSAAKLQQSDQQELSQKLSEYATEANLEKERLILEIAEVRKELEQKLEIITTLESQVSSLRDQIKAPEELAQHDSSAELDRLTQVIAQLSQDLKLKDELASSVSLEKESLENQLTRSREEAQVSMESQLQEHERKMQELVEGHRLEVDSLKKSMKDAEESHEGHIEVVKAESMSSLQEVENSSGLISELREKLSDQESTIEKQAHDIASLRDETHQDGQCISDLQGQIAALEEQLRASRGESDTAFEEKLQETIKSHNLEMEKMKSEADEILRVKEELLGEMAVEKDSLIESMTTLREEAANLRSELENTVTLAVHEEKTLALEKEISELKESLQNGDVSAEVEMLKQKLATKEEEHSTTISSLKLEHESQQTKLSDEISFTEERLVKSELDEQKVKVEQSTEDASVEEKKAEVLAREQQQLLSQMTQKFEVIEAENLTLKSTIAYLEQAIEAKSKVSVTIEETSAEQCVALRFEIEALKANLAQKELDVKGYTAQVHQHSITIVAIEERLNQVVLKNREYREEIENLHQEIQRQKITIEESQRERIVTVVNTPPTPALHTTVVHQPPSNQQGLVRLRRENANLKNQNDQAQKVIAGLRRDITGLGARLSDVSSEIDESKKREIDNNRVKLSETGRELSDHKGKVKELFKVVDEKLAETRRLNAEVKRLKEGALKLKKLVGERDKQVKDLEDRLDKLRAELDAEKKDQQEKGKLTADLAALGAACRGERHTDVISNQKSALNELRLSLKSHEQWPRPAPTHEEALHQVMLLKKELAEIRARECMSQAGITVTAPPPPRVSTDTAFAAFEKSAHTITMETLDLSENSYLGLLKSVSVALDVEDLDGLRRLAHIPHDEQLRLYREREQTCIIVSNRIELLRERLRRKEELLTGYEQDLARLHRLEETCGLQEQQVKLLTSEIRERTEEGQCLRYSLDKARNKNGETGRHYITAVNERKSNKSKESSELMKKKNYEIKVLKSELERKDYQLDSIKKQIVEVNTVKKTPSPPVGRPSSAKVRRARPTSAKRPMSAKVTKSTLSTTSAVPPRSPSPPRSIRTPRELVEENYQVISSTDEIRRSLEVGDRDLLTSQDGRFGIEESTVTVQSDGSAEEVVTAVTSTVTSNLSSALTSGVTSSFLTETVEVGEGGSTTKGVTFSTQLTAENDSSDF